MLLKKIIALLPIESMVEKIVTVVAGNIENDVSDKVLEIISENMTSVSDLFANKRAENNFIADAVSNIDTSELADKVVEELQFDTDFVADKIAEDLDINDVIDRIVSTVGEDKLRKKVIARFEGFEDLLDPTKLFEVVLAKLPMDSITDKVAQAIVDRLVTDMDRDVEATPKAKDA